MDISDDDVKAIAQELANLLRPAIENAITHYARSRTAKRRKAITNAPLVERLMWCMKNAAHYAKDARYGRICAQGVMPHSKLLKLSKIPAQQFAGVIEQAVLAGQIEPCCHPDTNIACYRIPDKQPAQEPAKAVMAALDDPAQDSHTWDFATAVKQAKEREWWERG